MTDLNAILLHFVRNYFYLFEKKSFYTAKALNMAIPGAEPRLARITMVSCLPVARPSALRWPEVRASVP